MDYSPPGSSVHGSFQARILEGVAISYSRRSSWPRDQTHVSCISCIGRRILYDCTPQENQTIFFKATKLFLFLQNVENFLKEIIFLHSSNHSLYMCMIMSESDSIRLQTSERYRPCLTCQNIPAYNTQLKDWRWGWKAVCALLISLHTEAFLSSAQRKTHCFLTGLHTGVVIF